MYYQNPYMTNPYMMQQYQQPYQTQQVQQYQQPQYQQSQYQQQSYPQPQQQSAGQLSGQMVDSLEAAKAKDIDMSGNPRFYPNINGAEIYMKQLQPDGTCQTVTYRRVNDQPAVIAAPQPDMTQVLQAMEGMKQQIVQEILDGMKQIQPTMQPTKKNSSIITP